MECKLSELVVFFKTAIIKFSKTCELNHHNIYYMLRYQLDNSAEPENIVSESKTESCEGIVKKFDNPKNPLMEGKAAAEIDDAISSSHDVPKRTSLDRELVDQKENQVFSLYFTVPGLFCFS